MLEKKHTSHNNTWLCHILTGIKGNHHMQRREIKITLLVKHCHLAARGLNTSKTNHCLSVQCKNLYSITKHNITILKCINIFSHLPLIHALLLLLMLLTLVNFINPNSVQQLHSWYFIKIKIQVFTNYITSPASWLSVHNPATIYLYYCFSPN